MAYKSFGLHIHIHDWQYDTVTQINMFYFVLKDFFLIIDVNNIIFLLTLFLQFIDVVIVITTE